MARRRELCCRRRRHARDLCCCPVLEMACAGGVLSGCCYPASSASTCLRADSAPWLSCSSIGQGALGCTCAHMCACFFLLYLVDSRAVACAYMVHGQSSLLWLRKHRPVPMLATTACLGAQGHLAATAVASSMQPQCFVVRAKLLATHAGLCG
jgi:hypothetical protein